MLDGYACAAFQIGVHAHKSQVMHNQSIHTNGDFKMEKWICDTCGGYINNADDGWVEWISLMSTGKSPSGRGLRLVHDHSSSPRANKCQYNSDVEYRKDKGTLSDLSLEDFLGPDGLMRLLVFISENELPKDEVLEMIKRLHIPGYELARNHFQKAINDGIFEPNMPKNFYNQSDIDATLRYIEADS